MCNVSPTGNDTAIKLANKQVRFKLTMVSGLNINSGAASRGAQA